MYKADAYVVENNDIVYLKTTSDEYLTYVSIGYIEEIQKRMRQKLTMNKILGEGRGELEEYIRNHSEDI